MNVQGKIIVLNDTETIGSKEFKKRLVVVQTEETYPQTIPVEFTQDKTTILNSYKVGDLVKIGINLRGSEWQGKYYANIQGWRIEKSDNEAKESQRTPPFDGKDPINNALQQEEEFDSLPF